MTDFHTTGRSQHTCPMQHQFAHQKYEGRMPKFYAFAIDTGCDSRRSCDGRRCTELWHPTFVHLGSPTTRPSRLVPAQPQTLECYIPPQNRTIIELTKDSGHTPYHPKGPLGPRACGGGSPGGKGGACRGRETAAVQAPVAEEGSRRKRWWRRLMQRVQLYFPLLYLGITANLDSSQTRGLGLVERRKSCRRRVIRVRLLFCPTSRGWLMLWL
jgi:hypothetical protein